uniref:BICD family like cargo adaptor 1 n=1 Tax=Electrophorus electricus TaxID=8005 RepID=A0AAY5EN98_ELEEL
MAQALDTSLAASRDAGGCQTRAPLHAGPGGLGMALEEELAMLTGEREEEDAPELSALEAPGNVQDADLLSLFRQKERDLVLAAKLGKALLERNQDLTKQYEQMNRDLNEKLEHLEQEKYELRCRMERREGEWEGRVAELEADLQQLQGELDRERAQLREVDRGKTRAITELADHNQRLMEQLSRAAEVERQLSTQVHSLQDDFREKSVSTNQHMTRLESLQAEIKMLSERKRELERRVTAALEENEQLQNAVDGLRERTLALEKRCHEKDVQLQQSQLELQEVRVSHRQLSARFEELSEERNLQVYSPTSPSLLCEIEQSMEQEELEQEREQLRLQLWETYCQVRSICSQLRGNDITDSALSTDSSMDESSETSSAKDVPTGSLQSSLLELRRLTQNLLDGNESTVALLSVEVCSSREENERLKTIGDAGEPSDQLQSAIRDRDDAIAKKKAVELELAKCKLDVMSLNSQLLDAIQQKLSLSQQLEAWQDDMHRVIDQQLKEKHHDEWQDPPRSASADPRGPASRPTHRLPDGEKRLFSFFKKN